MKHEIAPCGEANSTTLDRASGFKIELDAVLGARLGHLASKKAAASRRPKSDKGI